MSERIDINRPSTWIFYKSGLCKGCYAGCCTMPVEVRIADLVRMGVVAEDEVSGSLKKVAKRLVKAGIIKTFRAKTGLFMLEQKQNGDCFYLDQNRLCTIYERRPDVCRDFPRVGPRPGFCPRKSHNR